MTDNLFEEVKNNLKEDKSNHLTIMHDIVVNSKLKTIVECGVDRGASTCAFLQAIKETDGNLYSFDIKNCSNLFKDKNWNFSQINDVDLNRIINKFPEIKEKGIDLLYIDSYHEPSHVKKILNLYYPLLNINGYIFVDDTSSYPFRKLNILTDSINSDLCKEEVEEFFYSNFNTFEFNYNGSENGLSMLKKIKEDELNKNYIWKYNFFIYQIFKLIKKIKYKFFYKC